MNTTPTHPVPSEQEGLDLTQTFVDGTVVPLPVLIERANSIERLTPAEVLQGRWDFDSVEGRKDYARAVWLSGYESCRIAYTTAQQSRIAALEGALRPFAAVADEYDKNCLDECRPEWNGKNDSETEILTGRGGKPLLSLSHFMAARALLPKEAP